MSIPRIAALLLIALGLAGCSLSQPSQQRAAAEPEIWLRTDGQSGRTNPALAAQFDADKAACTVAGGGIDRACMTSRAYILVPASQAEATAARLRASNSAN